MNEKESLLDRQRTNAKNDRLEKKQWLLRIAKAALGWLAFAGVLALLIADWVGRFLRLIGWRS